MKKILLILTLFISLNSISYSDNHFPITRDSELMIARGKIVYQNNVQWLLIYDILLLQLFFQIQNK